MKIAFWCFRYIFPIPHQIKNQCTWNTISAQNHLPGTSASNIYPALKNMAALLIVLFSCSANIPWPVFWGFFSRCKTISSNMAAFWIVAPDTKANTKTPLNLKEKGVFFFHQQVTCESANTSLSKTRLRFLVLAGNQTISIPSSSI